MKNPVLDDIMKYAASKLNTAYSYCGLAGGESAAMLNSSDGEGNDILITIKSLKEAS